VTFQDAAAKDTKAQFTTVGTYTLKLTASDGSLTGEDSLQVTVNPAVYPTADTDETNLAYGWLEVAPADVGMDAAKLAEAQAYAESGGGAGLISRHGRLVYKWGDIDNRVDLKSATKSIGGIAFGLALDEQKVNSLNDLAQTYLPTLGARDPNDPAATPNDPTWLSQITIRQLATHTSGFEKTGGYGALIYQPGTTWSYSDGALNWLADLLTNVYGQDLSVLLTTRVWSPLGVTTDDVQWRDNADRAQTNGAGIAQRELSSGIVANPNAMARVGLLFLRKGVWANDQRILSESFVQTVQTPQPENANVTIADPVRFPGATSNYGVLWWTNATGQLANVPKDAYWGWGLGDSLIVVIPSLDLVIARVGSNPNDPTQPHWRTVPGTEILDGNGAPIPHTGNSRWDGDYTVLDPFLTPISQSVTQ
jgi:CubicO group peptidase (beta-lactamase class C family)